MIRDDVYKRLDAVFQDVFDDDSIHVNDKTVAEDVDGWDSFEHISLVAAIEKEFSFKIPINKVMSLKNVGEMTDLILEMGK